MKGMKFRRQHPIGPYIIDFYCSSAKLAVELDGGGHTEKLQKLHDQNRERFLASKGIKVMRFWDTEVWKELESVLREIWDRLPDNPSPCPLPFPRGEGKAIEALSPFQGERVKLSRPSPRGKGRGQSYRADDR